MNAQPDLRGLFVNGGGVGRVPRAIREDGASRRIAAVCFDLTSETRSALIDGVISLVLSHPREALAQSLVAAMAEATTTRAGESCRQFLLPIDIVTPENL